LTSKGQITIPAEVRQALRLAKGDRVEFTRAGDGFLMRSSGRSVDRLAGFFGPQPGPAVSIEQMNKDIATEASR
jgi:AbrB family looped-hinge helix DNA binding protein